MNLVLLFMFCYGTLAQRDVYFFATFMDQSRSSIALDM
jgi:hypothetical protein